MNDPLGDMLTRIRNASMRGKSTVRTPASKIRSWVLDVLQPEGYIRGYEEVTADGHPELEISLKYFDGQPVIRELSPRLDARPPGLFRRQGDPAGPPGPRHRHRLDAEGRHVRRAGPHRQCRRRSPLHGVLRRAACLASARSRSTLPGGVTATVSGQTVEVKGPKGTRAFTATDDVTIAVEDGAVTVKPRGTSKRARQQWGMSAHPGREPRHRRDRRASRRRWRSPASAIAPRSQGKILKLAARLQPRRRFRDPGGRHHHDAEADRDHRRGHRPAGGRPGRGRTSATGASPSPTRARASSTRASSSSARKGRRSKGRNHGEQQARSVPEAPPARPEQAAEDGAATARVCPCIGRRRTSRSR